MDTQRQDEKACELYDGMMRRLEQIDRERLQLMRDLRAIEDSWDKCRHKVYPQDAT